MLFPSLSEIKKEVSDTIETIADFVAHILENYSESNVKYSSELLTWIPDEGTTRKIVREFLSQEKEKDWINRAIERDPALLNKALNPAIFALRSELERQDDQPASETYERIKNNLMSAKPIDPEDIMLMLDAVMSYEDDDINADEIQAIKEYAKSPSDKGQEKLFHALESVEKVLRPNKLLEAIRKKVSKRIALDDIEKEALINAVNRNEQMDESVKALAIESVENFPKITETIYEHSINELLMYQGLHAVAWHKKAHELYEAGETTEARKISQAVRRLTAGIEIHPGATIGKNFFIDHGTGVVIGETANIGDNVMLYHRVTLGNYGDLGPGRRRHPKIGDNTTISTGAEILGAVTIGKNVSIKPGTKIVGNNVTIGDGADIGTNLFIRSNVKPNSKVVGNTMFGEPIYDEVGLFKENTDKRVVRHMYYDENGKIKTRDGKSPHLAKLKAERAAQNTPKNNVPRDQGAELS